MTEQAVKTITVDGTEYQLGDFSKEIQQLVSVHQKWEVDLVEKRLALAQVEAAIRDLTRELSGKIKAHLEAQASAQEATGEATDNAPVADAA